MGEYKFRAAQASDAPAFSKWVAGNPQIDPKDIEASMKAKNPTVIYLAVEDEAGEVVAFAPFYCQMTLGYLGFNPEKGADARKKALQTMLDGAMAFAVQFGVREITTMTRENYPVAKWATKHGFDVDPRQLLKFDINNVLDQAKEK